VNIGADEGTGMPNSPYKDIGYVSSVSGVDNADPMYGSVNAPWRTISFGKKYGVNLIVEPGYYTTGEVWPIFVCEGAMTGMDRANCIIQEPSTAYPLVIGTRGIIENLTIISQPVSGLGSCPLIAIDNYANTFNILNNNLIGAPGEQFLTAIKANTSSTANFTNGYIYRNLMQNTYGGVQLVTNGVNTVEGCTIVKIMVNTVAYGIQVGTGTVFIKDCIISASPEGSAPSGSYGVYVGSGTATCTYNDVYLVATLYSGCSAACCLS